MTEQEINLYPEASPEDRERLAAIREDGGALVRFLFQAPSLDKNKSDRKEHMSPTPETTDLDNQ